MPDEARAPDPAVIVDHRVILFRRPALCEAFGRSPHAPRTGAGTRPAIFAEPAPAKQSVCFTTEGESGAGMTLNSDDLCALMIGYCVGARIPIPARATKTVHVTAQGVTIEFRSSFKSLPTYEVERKREVKTNGDWAR